MLANFVVIYVILGLPAASLIWMAMIASKQNDDIAQNVKHSEYQRFYERKTGPSRLHS